MTLKNIDGPNRNSKLWKKEMLTSGNKNEHARIAWMSNGFFGKWKSTHQESDQVHRWGDSWSAEKRNPEISKRSREIDQGFCKNATVWDRTRWSWEPTHYTRPCQRVKLVVFVDRTHQTQNESGRTSSFSNVHVWDVRKWTRRPDWSEIGQKAKKAEVQPAALGQRRLSLLSLHTEWVSTAKVMEWPPRRRRTASGVGVQLPTRSLPPPSPPHSTVFRNTHFVQGGGTSEGVHWR